MSNTPSLKLEAYPLSTTVVPKQIQDVGLDWPPGTTQGDLDCIAAHEQKVRDMIHEYIVKTDAEWDLHVAAGKPDLIDFCLATGCLPNDTMLRLIARQRHEKE